jgi:hypothetical protein
LAKVASEKLDEMQDPELGIDRALENYMNLGYSENRINQISHSGFVNPNQEQLFRSF